MEKRAVPSAPALPQNPDAEYAYGPAEKKTRGRNQNIVPAT
jgi:hypothetical protein